MLKGNRTFRKWNPSACPRMKYCDPGPFLFWEWEGGVVLKRKNICVCVCLFSWQFHTHILYGLYHLHYFLTSPLPSVSIIFIHPSTVLTFLLTQWDCLQEWEWGWFTGTWVTYQRLHRWRNPSDVSTKGMNLPIHTEIVLAVHYGSSCVTPLLLERHRPPYALTTPKPHVMGVILWALPFVMKR